ncbi:hypothetical protein BZA70DRAFT_88547 [Myxozyma melibiosi]|uniref:Uncharacterized protein n=1 Tax=Myxozyma melibiosi TaxID=54550 RepID=A0ABR1EZH3_9ASCO
MENQSVARARCASNDENAYPSSPPLSASKRETGYDITTASTARALLNVTNLLPKRHTLSNGATTTSTASPRHYRSATASSPGDNITWSVLPKTTLLSSESDIQSVTNAEASSPIAESTAQPAAPLPCYTSAGDPATELLKRYHAHLDDSVYSEAAGTPSSKVGVRRSISCEPEWPRSALRKRRKQKAVEVQQEEEAAVPVDAAAADPASAASAVSAELANTANDADANKKEAKEEEEEDYFGSEDDFDLADLDQMEARLDAKSNGDKQQPISTISAKPDVASATSFGEFENVFSDDINTSQLKQGPPPGVKAENTKGFGDSFDDLDDEMDDNNLDPYEVDRLLTQFEQAVPEKKVQ